MFPPEAEAVPGFPPTTPRGERQTAEAASNIVFTRSSIPIAIPESHDGGSVARLSIGPMTAANLAASVRSAIVNDDDGFAVAEVVGGDFSNGIVLLCDHARNRLPARYGSLGLPAAEFTRHIAYDIGAEAVTRALAASLHAASGHLRILAAADRSEPGSRRSDADHETFRRRHRAGQRLDHP
jgi:hypothetical protein